MGGMIVQEMAKLSGNCISKLICYGKDRSSAKTRLKNRLSKLYAGLASDDQLSKVDIDLSLQKARSIVINITNNSTR